MQVYTKNEGFSERKIKFWLMRVKFWRAETLVKSCTEQKNAKNNYKKYTNCKNYYWKYYENVFQEIIIDFFPIYCKGKPVYHVFD